MRQFFILRGLPATGKDTFIKNNNLEKYTVSTDALRQVFSTPEDTFHKDHYEQRINQHVNKYIFPIVEQALVSHFKYGQTVFYNATNLTQKDVNTYAKLAEPYGYKVTVINFGENISLNEVLERNKQRPEIDKVPEFVLKSMYEKFINTELSHRTNVITPKYFNLAWKDLDISQYEKLIFIGDVHSCATPLKSIINNFSDSNYYCLLGDFFDRGIQPKETMELLLKIIDKPNVCFIEGNHENHLRNWVQNENKKLDTKLTGHNFKVETKPYLNIKDVKRLLRRLQPVAAFKFNGKKIIATHAGLLKDQMNLQNKFILQNQDFFIKGVGGYDNDIDSIYDNDLNNEIIQVHGHRNAFMLPVIREDINNQHSFNLEQKVEYGNDLGVLTFSSNNGKLKIKNESIKNTVHNKSLTPFDKYSEMANFNGLRQSKYVKQKTISSDIIAYNFSDEAFRKNIWDKQTIKARGLFCDSSNHVVARAYDKFFNLDQMPESELDYILTEYPKSQYIKYATKYDGFLTIVSYVPKLNGLFITSKGNGEKYSEYAKQVLNDTLKENGFTLKDLENHLKEDYENDKRYSLIFETVCPEVDPHLIGYNFTKSILLDVVNNTLDLKEKSDSFKQNIVNRFNFATPMNVTIDTSKLYKENVVNELNYVIQQSKVKQSEGIVVTAYDLDSNNEKIINHMFKSKSIKFLARKQFRNQLNGLLTDLIKVNTLKGQDNLIDKRTNNIKWLYPQNIVAWTKIIIELRKNLPVNEKTILKMFEYNKDKSIIDIPKTIDKFDLNI